jgi:outer membrane protein
MRRLPLAFALAAALTPFGAVHAEDLLQTYELARQGDPQYAAAESGRLVTREGAVQARAALLPQINGSATLRRTFPQGSTQSVQLDANGDPVLDANGDPVLVNSQLEGATSRTYGASLDQVLFDFGRFSTVRSRNALSKAGDYQLESAGDTLVTRTSAAYFNVLVALETLSAAEASETALKKQFDLADKRLEVGLAPITDVHEARAQYDSARANTILVRNALQDAYQALVEITGTPVATLKALPQDFQPALPAEKDVDGWIGTALESNPALKSQEFQVQSAEADVSTARAGHLPTLYLGADYSDSKTISGGSALDENGFASNGSRGGSVGLTLSVPIFSGGATQSRVRQALAQRDVTRDQYEQQKRALERNTRNAYQTLVAGVSEVEARRLAVVSAKSAYDASQVGLEVGTRTVVDVLINQQNLFNAQQAYAQAKYTFPQNRLLHEQAAGPLDVDDVQDVNRLLTVETPLGEARP